MQHDLDLFGADVTWFHLFRSMIQSGQIAELGTSVFAVYCVVKSHSNFQTGTSFVSVSRIGELTGLGKRAVLNCMAKLKEKNLIHVEKIGRQNYYRINEHLPVVDSNKNQVGTFSFEYQPTKIVQIKQELEQFLRHGIPQNARVTININQAEVIHIQNN